MRFGEQCLTARFCERGGDGRARRSERLNTTHHSPADRIAEFRKELGYGH
jgi:hypothetical protein